LQLFLLPALARKPSLHRPFSTIALPCGSPISPRADCVSSTHPCSERRRRPSSSQVDPCCLGLERQPGGGRGRPGRSKRSSGLGRSRPLTCAQPLPLSSCRRVGCAGAGGRPLDLPDPVRKVGCGVKPGHARAQLPHTAIGPRVLGSCVHGSVAAQAPLVAGREEDWELVREASGEEEKGL
jgi:hypothetical protein